jgi:hypothetical protein
MSNPTPKYNKGDRVEVPHRNTEGEIAEQWYNEPNNSWVYRVMMHEDDLSHGIYQEKNLEQ